MRLNQFEHGEECEREDYKNSGFTAVKGCKLRRIGNYEAGTHEQLAKVKMSRIVVETFRSLNGDYGFLWWRTLSISHTVNISVLNAIKIVIDEFYFM